MGFDLNTPGGFAALTGGLGDLNAGVGGAAAILNSFAGGIAQNWDIVESSYGHTSPGSPKKDVQIKFHIFNTAADFNAAVDQVQDTGGRRKIPIIFPYREGQSTDDLGGMGESFDFNVLIFGPNYKAQYKKLLLEMNKPEPGVLIHPVRGPINAVAESWLVTHSCDKRQAVALRIRFIQHTFNVTYANIPDTKNVFSVLTAAIGFLAEISAIINKVESVLFVVANTRALVKAVLEGYFNSYTYTLSNLNQTFNPGTSASLPGIIPGLNPTVPGQDPNVFGVVTNPSPENANAFAGTGSTVASQATGSSQQLSAAVASQQAVALVIALREQLQTGIEEIQATEGGEGALIFYDDILTLKQSSIAIQNVLEAGLQSSKNKIIKI